MMGVNSLPKTVTLRRRGWDLNPGPPAPESSTLTTRLPSHPTFEVFETNQLHSVWQLSVNIIINNNSNTAVVVINFFK